MSRLGTDKGKNEGELGGHDHKGTDLLVALRFQLVKEETAETYCVNFHVGDPESPSTIFQTPALKRFRG